MSETAELSKNFVGEEVRFDASDIEKTYYRVGLKGASMAVAKSVLQKSIRRGDADTATYWAGILLGSFKIANLFNRLLTIASEDIGPADDSALEAVVKGYNWYSNLRQKSYTGRGEWKNMRDIVGIRLLVDGLVRMLCAAPKSRACDHACIGVIGPIFDGPSDVEAGDWMNRLRSRLDAKDVVGTLENLASAFKSDRSTVSQVLTLLEDRGCKTAVISARAILATKDKKKARPPFMPIVHGLFSAMKIGQDGGSTMTTDAMAVTSLYSRLIGQEALKTPPDYAFDMHVRGVSKGSVKTFVESEHSALLPRVKAEEVAFPELDLYERARGPGAAARESAKLSAKKHS